jgi:hypothetical protein
MELATFHGMRITHQIESGISFPIVADKTSTASISGNTWIGIQVLLWKNWVVILINRYGFSPRHHLTGRVRCVRHVATTPNRDGTPDHHYP